MSQNVMQMCNTHFTVFQWLGHLKGKELNHCDRTVEAISTKPNYRFIYEMYLHFLFFVLDIEIKGLEC